MWQVITRDLVVQRATTIESDVVDTIGANGESPLQQCIDSACDEVRTAILQGGTKLDATKNSVPASLVNTALSIIVYHFASRALNDGLLVQGSRYQEYARALSVLDEIRAGKTKVEDPETGELNNTQNSAEIVRDAPRAKMQGIYSL